MSRPAVLIVEDNADLAKAMLALLRRSGFSATSTGNGQTAMDVVRAVRPQLVLLDINLPFRNGLQILQEIRNDQDLNDLPVVIYTAIDEPRVREEAISLGAVDYIVKGSLDGTLLENLVRRYIPAAA